MKVIVCKGCFVSDCCPLIPQNEVTQTCPCTICLVKGVCQISCDLYDIFEEGYYSDSKHTTNETYKEDTYDSREEYMLKMRLIAGK